MAIRINTNELLQILEKTPASQNIMLMGKHGIGKSKILETFFTDRGSKVVPLFLGQMSDPGDLIGLLNKNEATGKTEFMPPYWFPTDGKPIVLFLDELNRARPEVLQTIMDLALNRTLAGKKLPDGSRIISAVNNGEEYQLTDLDPALVSRFNIYEFSPTPQEWLLWAAKSRLDERVINFIAEHTDFLDGDGTKNDENSLEKTPDRRAWERVSQTISGEKTLDSPFKKIIAGIVGSRAANAFFESIRTHRLLSGKDVLAGDFRTVAPTIARYSTPELAALNDSIFRFVETESKTLGEKQKALASENLLQYFALLKNQGKREAMAHFAALFTGNDYPNTLIFVVENASGLYSEITKFIGEIK